MIKKVINELSLDVMSDEEYAKWVAEWDQKSDIPAAALANLLARMDRCIAALEKNENM